MLIGLRAKEARMPLRERKQIYFESLIISAFGRNFDVILNAPQKQRLCCLCARSLISIHLRPHEAQQASWAGESERGREREQEIALC